MTVGAQFATRNEVEQLRRKLTLAISGKNLVSVNEYELVAPPIAFLNLTDVPVSYAAAGNWVVRVKSTVDQLEFADLKGTTNQVTVTENAADYTLSLPQDIHTGASPTFVTAKLSALTDGYVPYHVNDATGLADSVIYTDGVLVGVGMIPTTAQLEVADSLIIESSTSGDNPYLKIINASDIELDPIIQYAVGATPITRWTHGLDDSLLDDWFLCAGDILTDVVEGDTSNLDITYDGYLVIADWHNDRIKKHLSVDGAYQAKIGTVGTGNNEFQNPIGICSDGTHVYVTDYYNHRIKKHLLSDMSFVAAFGTEGAGNNQFQNPSGICTDGTNLYIADTGNSRIKKHLCSDLSYVTKSTISAAAPLNICVNGTYIYAAPPDPGATYRIYKYLCSDLSLVLRVMPTGNDGHIDSANIVGLCTTGGYLYLLNSHNAVSYVPFYKYLCGDLTYSSEFGTFGTGDGQFSYPRGICTDGTNLFVAEGEEGVSARIQKLLLDGTFVYKYGSYGIGNTQFDLPTGICVSGTIAGTIYTPYRAPILRAKADGTACESYVSFQLRDEIRFLEDSVANANYIAIQAPASVTSYKLILPGATAGAKKNLQVGATDILAWTQNVDTDGTPTFANITDSGLTATHPVFTDSNKKLVSTGTLPVDHGGTGLASFAIGDILHATAATTIARLADVAVGSYLRSGGVGVISLWSTLILPNAATAYRLPVATGANTIGELAAVGATGQYLAGVTGAIPAWANLVNALALADLSDVYFLSGEPDIGDVLTYESGGWTSMPPAGGAGAFLDLTDVDEPDYIGHAAEFVVVNGAEDGLEFSASSVAGHALGSVNHTDVNAAAPNDDDFLSWDAATGKWIPVAGGGGGVHALLSATHSDTLADSVLRGDVMIGNVTPKWSRLAKGAANQVLGGDGTDSKWVTACPVAGKYIVGLAHADLSAEKVKAQLYNNYDIDDTPGSPNAMDDEFDNSSLDGKWTIVNNPAGGNAVSETAYPGYLWVGLPELVTDTFDTLVRVYQVPPAADAWTFIIKASVGVEGLASSTDAGEFTGVGIYVGTLADDELIATIMQYNDASGDYFACRLQGQNDMATTTFYNYQIVPAGGSYYLKLEKATANAYTSANTYNMYYSFNGITWYHCGQHSKTFTHACDELGICFRAPKAQGGTPIGYGIVDFFRRTV